MNEDNKNLLPSGEDDKTRQDVSLIRKSIANYWDVKQETKDHVIKSILAILNNPDVSTKDKVSTIRLLAEFNKLNLDTYKVLKDDVNEDDSDGEITIVIK